MASPFGKDGGPINNVSRNTFDNSYQNNVTCPLGAIVPVGLWPTIPGDHWKIDTTFGLRFMPTAFPLQTRMRADVHFFYVRQRALYEDWMDHYGMKSYGTNSKQTVPPFISPKNARSKDMFSTGSLGDYLGVPTTLIGEYGQPGPLEIDPDLSGVLGTTSGGYPTLKQFSNYSDGVILLDGSQAVVSYPDRSEDWVYPSGDGYAVNINTYSTEGFKGTYFSFSYDVNLSSPAYALSVRPVLGFVNAHGSSSAKYYGFSHPGTYQIKGLDGLDWTVNVKSKLSSSVLSVTISISAGSVIPQLPEYISCGCLMFQPEGKSPYFWTPFPATLSYGSVVNDIIDVPNAVIPWEIKPINSYVFRAYEMIYNSFYRDERNNPYVLDGEVQYNKYLPTTAGGEDTNIYKLHYRNWEQDFLTTAVPTPQMGPAPLVGISSLGEMSIQDPESGQVYKVMAKTADDADTIVGMDVTETLPNTVMRSLVNYATSGISINDFRNVNAFQRWLETNIRKGFKYKDQIKAHYGVDIRFDELNMPEFIGGASIDVTPTTITQTSQDSEDNPLGSYAGQLYGSGSSKHSVSQYCDEHGYIIALMSVVPVPNYSQLMPKHFWKMDSLDYFSPEFGHIGLQPIPAREVCPNQMAQDPNADFEKDVFGYQRAHYDYLQRVDEVHGQFRTSLRNFIMNRVFDSKPSLGPSFTVIDPNHLNDVFTVQSIVDPNTGQEVVVDKILGQVYFNVSAKRPIPKYGVPRLE